MQYIYNTNGCWISTHAWEKTGGLCERCLGVLETLRDRSWRYDYKQKDQNTEHTDTRCLQSCYISVTVWSPYSKSYYTNHKETQHTMYDIWLDFRCIVEVPCADAQQSLVLYVLYLRYLYNIQSINFCIILRLKAIL